VAFLCLVPPLLPASVSHSPREEQALTTSPSP
jgi:hypothetical protein